LLETLSYTVKILKSVQVRNIKKLKKKVYKGPSDPIHGDSFNKAVREAAKETIAAVFERSDNSSSNSVWLKNKTSEDIYHQSQTIETFSNIGQLSSNNYGNHYVSGESSSDNRYGGSGGIQGGSGSFTQGGLQITSSGGIGPAPEKDETGKKKKETKKQKKLGRNGQRRKFQEQSKWLKIHQIQCL
jgi:hypothetical protein